MPQENEDFGKTRVAFICDDLMLGGWTTLAELLPELGKHGFSPFVVCLFGKGYYAEILEQKGFTVYCLGLKKSNAAYSLLKLVKILRSENAAVVHTNLHYSDIFGLSAAILAGVRKRFVHIHSIDEPYKFKFHALKRFLLSRASMIVPVSAAAEISFKEEYRDIRTPFKVVHNGINVREFRTRKAGSKLKKGDFGIPENSFVALTVANFKVKKGYPNLVEAIAMLKDIDAHFLFAGYGAEEEAVKTAAETAGTERNIHFLGARADVPEIMKIADAFILPSLVEPFGICILEAFAGDIPVIASSAGGINEIAENMRTAVLVPPGNSRELAQAIKLVRKNSALRASLVENAAREVKNYDIDIVAQKIAGCYNF